MATLHLNFVGKRLNMNKGMRGYDICHISAAWRKRINIYSIENELEINEGIKAQLANKSMAANKRTKVFEVK